MSRVILGVVCGTLVASSAGAAYAADFRGGYDPVFRPSYPMDWQDHAMVDPLGFEVGLRYWYAMGNQDFRLGTGTYSAEDVAHVVEGHLRIDDFSTSTYLKGSIGYAANIAGTYSTPQAISDFEGGRLAYAGADFGYTPFSTDAFRFGTFAGYQYLNDSPDMGRSEFLVPETISWTPGNEFYTFGMDSNVNSIDIHALRLGVSAQADLGGFMDINAEVAAIPYAWVDGVLGPHGFGAQYDGFTYTAKSSPTTFSGHLYGGAGEVMLGFHPTDNLTVRAGARAYYLTGPVTASFSRTSITDPVDIDPDSPGYEGAPEILTQNYVQDFSNFEMFRWGPMIEITGRF